MKDTQLLSINIRRLREAKQLSQNELAERSSVGLQTIFRAESKGVIPRGANLEKIAKALEVSVSDLFDDKGTSYQGAEATMEELKIRLDKIEGLILNNGRIPAAELSTSDIEALRSINRANSYKRSHSREGAMAGKQVSRPTKNTDNLTSQRVTSILDIVGLLPTLDDSEIRAILALIKSRRPNSGAAKKAGA